MGGVLQEPSCCAAGGTAWRARFCARRLARRGGWIGDQLLHGGGLLARCGPAGAFGGVSGEYRGLLEAADETGGDLLEAERELF